MRRWPLAVLTVDSDQSTIPQCSGIGKTKFKYSRFLWKLHECSPDAEVFTSPLFNMVWSSDQENTVMRRSNVRAIGLPGFETTLKGDKTEGSLRDKHCYSFLWLWNGTQVKEIDKELVGSKDYN